MFAGNEKKILDVTVAVHQFFASRDYLKGGKLNAAFDAELADIVFFLILNAEFNSPLELDEYAHLINIMPLMSRCVLANIVIALDLNRYYCRVLEKLPLSLSEQLLSEIISCLKTCNPRVQLDNSYIFLESIVRKLATCQKVCMYIRESSTLTLLK